MDAHIIRFAARAAAVAALALGFLAGSASLAAAQVPGLPPELAPPGGEEPQPPDEGGGPESPLPDELDPLTDPLAPVLDPILEQLPGDDAETPEEGGDPGDGGSTDDGSTDDGSTESDFATPSAAGASSLPRTGGTVAMGLASALAVAALALRRVLRA